MIRAFAMVLAAAAATASAARAEVVLEGRFSQGGLVLGRTQPDAVVALDGERIRVDDMGRFFFGFDRDHGETSTLTVTYADGRQETRDLDVAQREYNVQRIDGLPPSKVTPRTPDELAQIEREWLLKQDAKQNIQDGAWYRDQFHWPARGVITGVFGSQRILNGEPRRPHYGLDIAAPEGTPIEAPAGGVVVLAETGMYFEGGLVLLDHGHGLLSALMHMSRIDVSVGEQVEQGDVIGAIGATGRATGPHLHWGLQWAGKNLDPELLLPERASLDPAQAAD